MRYGLSIIAIIVFVIIAIIVIASGGHKTAPIKTGINVANYNNTESSVSQITYGNLLSEGKREALEITISQSQTNVYLLSGYESTASPIDTYANTPAAYGTFLGALETYGYSDSRTTTEKYPNAICPLGNTYRYELNNGSKLVSNLWSTSCKASDGTFSGDGPLIRQLFELQVPNFNTIALDTGL